MDKQGPFNDSVSATAPASVVEHERKLSPNLIGTIVFAGFALLSLVVCFARGIVPIYAGEAVAWGLLSWYWYKKPLFDMKANLAVLVLAVIVAAVEGYSYGRHSVSKSYTYLTSGNFQYRVDSQAGRTDRLTASNGWEPVSFDGPAENIFKDDPFGPYAVDVIVLSNGTWGANEICFDVQNNSHFVLQDVTISIKIERDPDSHGDYDVRLQRAAFGLKDDKPFVQAGGLLDLEKDGFFCGKTPRDLPSGSKWSYSLSSAKGWKQ